MNNTSISSKTIVGLSWGFLGLMLSSITQFIIGIVLARILTPDEFGIIGIASIFVSILPIFIDGGFTFALIRKKVCTEKDFSSVFYINAVTAILIYTILYLAAPFIGSLFDIPILVSILRVMGLSIVIGVIGIVPNAVLTRKLAFRTLTKIAIITQLISGSLAIFLAFKGFGLWALAIRSLVATLISKVAMIISATWWPKLIFDFNIVKQLFNFGSKLMFSLLLNTIFNNILHFVVAKFYNPAQLGLYTRADNFSKLPTEGVANTVHKVSFPVFSQLQHDTLRLKRAYRKVIINTTFISSILMFSLAASAQAFVLVTIGDKWLDSAHYLQLLCFSAFLYPVHTLNLNIMSVKGRSDLFLKVEIIKKFGLIPVFFMGIFYNIESMLICMIIFSLLSYFLNAMIGAPLIAYSVKEQLKDILPSVFFALFVGIFTFLTGSLIKNWQPLQIMISQLLISLLLIIVLGEVLIFYPYIEIKNIVVSRLPSAKKNSK